MRRIRPLAAVTAMVAAALSCSGAPTALAQTPAVDQRALDQLGPAPGSPRAPGVTRPSPPSLATPTAPAIDHVQTADRLRPSGSAAAAHFHPPAPAKPAATAGALAIPLAPPPGPVLPPPIAVPMRPVPPPAPAAVVADAPGLATRTATGLRITFGPERSDLNPGTEAALRTLAQGSDAANASYTVTSYAAGMPDDPSTPRRLSLTRALAVRSVLIAAGIPSVRIYVKALGAAGTEAAAGPPDRADIAITALPGTAVSAPSGQPPAPVQKAAP